jgi:colanic acid biosynthesis glycosyl transferase WcaI
MRILIHDFAGHAFQVQLSREFAKRGHEVTHVYPDGLPGPKGPLQRLPDDPPEFDCCAVPLSKSFRKYSALKRLQSQRRYARDLRKLIVHKKPDVVLSGNTPIDVQAELLLYCRTRRIAFVHWVQDIYCHAAEFFFRNKFPVLAKPLGFLLRQVERQVAHRSEAVVVISPAFEKLLVDWNVPASRITTIENWAPLDSAVYPRRNSFSEEHGLDKHVVFLYSGTLGLKHRPDLLYKLSEELDENCKVVVISEGIGRDYLERLPARENLLLLPFQPYERIPEILGTADVLLATLESEAGDFAVPSKVLSYLSAGRAVLLAAPDRNLASQVVTRSGAGISVDPDDEDHWSGAAQLLALDSALRAQAGNNATRYAEEHFKIGNIADSFQRVLDRALNGDRLPSDMEIAVSEA